MSDARSDGTAPSIGLTRLIVGFAQGLALYGLSSAFDAKQWPATDPATFSTLLSIALFIPTTVLAGLGALRLTTLLAWIVGATAGVVGLAQYSVWREVHPDLGFVSFGLLLSLGAGLFVAYHLVAAADLDRRVVASYRSYFDIAAKNAVQLGMSLAFVGAFWLLLHLGASLFELIKIQMVRTVIRENWFIFPATATVFAAAVHVTDVQVGLINGARNLALLLLSWLLPVMALLALAFLLALPFVGLEPLWAAVSATTLLLSAAAALAALINATYRDGEYEAPIVLRIGARLASLMLVPLVGIAAYSLWLRIDQHGLTPERVVGVACVAVAALYTIGYALAALWPGKWMKPLEMTNIATAFVALCILIALLTPAADPARIAVDDQMRRLKLGLVAPDKFDFAFLRDHASKYGREALDQLRGDKSSPRAQMIAQKAEDAFNYKTVPEAGMSQADFFAALAVYPQDTKLPDSFVQQDWSSDRSYPSPMACASGTKPLPCEAYVADVTGDGRADVAISMWMRLQVFSQKENGPWEPIGLIDLNNCGDVTPALRAGHIHAVPPVRSEVEIDGHRFQLINPACH